jgi:hypothetical protein
MGSISNQGVEEEERKEAFPKGSFSLASRRRGRNGSGGSCGMDHKSLADSMLT